MAAHKGEDMNRTELINAGIAVDELLNRIMNNTALIKVFVKKFLEDSNFENLMSAINRGDMKSAEGYCHTLKGMCGNMALTDLYSLFQAQLAYFRGGEYEKAVATMPKIMELYTIAVNHMTAWLAES